MAKGNKKRGPKAKKQPAVEKVPRVASNPESFYGRKAAWRISLLEMVDPFGWHEIDLATAHKVKAKLAGFESMTWNEILVRDSSQNHSVYIDALCKDAQNRLTEIEQEDVDKIISLRLSGTERVWGIFEEGIMRLLWWDPDHAVCPSNLKHT